MRRKFVQPEKAKETMERLLEGRTNWSVLIETELPAFKYAQSRKALLPMEEISAILKVLGILPPTLQLPLSRAVIKSLSLPLTRLKTPSVIVK
jgi:hypothetical protein